MSKNCRFCNSKLNTIFIDLGKLPLANSYLKENEFDDEKFYPLCAYVCNDCFLVQLEEIEKAENIFSDYAYFSSYSTSWLKHSQNYVEMITSKGIIVIRLYCKTEKHKNNFINLINCGFFEGVLFHRVIHSFVAQAGDPNSKLQDFKGELGEESYGETIPAEFFSEYYHKKGVISGSGDPQAAATFCFLERL